MIVGGHRDAWGHGAVDPGGGTATMIEMTRVIGDMLKEGSNITHTVFNIIIILLI